MDKKALTKLLTAIVLLTIAAFVMVNFFRSQNPSEEMVYFYDLSERKLFSAPRSSVPPIRGINNSEEDAVRAVVISNTEDSKDKKHRRIAYLEKYSPQLKYKFETVRHALANGQSSVDLIGHGEVPVNTFVRRIEDTNWHPLTSQEGEKIVSEWNVPNSDGKYPIVCVP